LRILKTQPIRRQLIVAATFLVLPLAAAVVWSANRTLREREAEVMEQAASIAATSAAYLNQYLDGLDSLASALARHPDVRALREPQSNRLFADMFKEQPLLLNALLLAPDGSIHGSALPLTAERHEPIRLPYVAQVVATRRPVVSEFTISRTTGKPAVVLGYPVFDDGGTLVGVLGMGVNLARLQTVFASIPLPAGSVITLTDRSSRILARSLEPERFIGTKISGTPFDPKDAPATIMSAGIDGVARFYGNATIDRGPWLLSVGIPQTVVMGRVRPLWQRNLAILSTLLVGTLIILIWFADGLARQLNRLRLAAQRIAGGDLAPPGRGRVSNLELGQLQDAFITMAANLRDTRDALDRQVEQERKMREMVQSLQRQVVRQERLTAVGLLVSGVAHELNNPLQAILGTLELLERNPTLTPDALEEVSFIKTQSGRAREIIRNLSRFSSQQSGPPALVDLRDVIDEIVQLRRRNLESFAIALDTDCASVRQVYANFTELEQVILNFVINAHQSIEAAGRGRGRILIRLFDAGKKVRVEVQDDGPGVNVQDEPKLFQPFFTTKPVGKGTGLGLSVSYGIIDSYGGAIGYSGNAWGGATFFFELPAAAAGAPSQVAAQP
jgi:C4-dicarboxylate-specific signal transduction histidine kinase